MKAKREALSPELKHEYDSIIYNQIVKILPNYKSIGIYCSMENEIDTLAIIQYCFKNKIKVSVPKVLGKNMIFVTITSFADLKPSILNILEPINSEENHDMEIMFTPLLAYNQKLQRLGYGGGYYDRYFSQKQIYKVGLAYHFSKIKADIFEDYDIALDKIITN